jgi:hypothetical protein
MRQIDVVLERSLSMRRVVLVVVLIASLLTFAVSQAATPSSGTVSPTQGSIAYTGSSITGVPPAISRRACIEDQNCDTFDLSVDVPAGFYDAADRVLTISISWADSANDLDLYLCSGTSSSDPQCANGLVASSLSTGTTTETVIVSDPAAGPYRVIAAAYSGTTDYAGSITFAAPATSSGPAPVRSKSNGFSWQARPVANDSSFAEPSIDVDHAGNIYVTAPGGAGVQMWRSFDGGFTFDHQEIGSNLGGGDSEIEFSLDDVGYTADLEITDSAVSRSTDRFDTWTQQGVGIEQDRQWLAHLCEKQVFLAYHDFVAEAEFLNRSDDGGLTWDAVPTPVAPPGSAPGGQDIGEIADQGGNTFSGPVAVDQRTGDVYVVFAISSAEGNLTTGTPPYGEPEQIVVAVSHDNGHSFQLHLVKSGGVGAIAGAIFPWITIDKGGNVYVSYAGRDLTTDPINVFMLYSTNHGDTWSTPYRVNTDATGHAHIYTTISAGDAGVVDVAWYTASTADPNSANNDWYVDFAQVRGANTSRPQIKQSRPYPYSIHHGDICLEGILCELGGDRSLLDFFQVQVGPDGRANIAFANNGSPDGALRVWYVGQTGGRLAGNGLQDTNWCTKTS